MDRVKINISNFKYPRIKMENFSFTKEEELMLNDELDKIGLMFTDRKLCVFSVSKQDGMYSGSIKVSPSDFYAYSKDPTAIGLFYKLRDKVKARVLDVNSLIK